MDLREEDFVSHIFVASTHAYIMIFSDRGRAYWLKVYEIPDVGAGQPRQGDRQPRVDGARREDRGAARGAQFPDEEDQQFIVMGTRKGVVKKTDLKAYANPRAGGIIAMGVEDDDALHRRAADRRQERSAHRHAARAGDPLPGGGRAHDGPHRLRRPRHRAREDDEVVAMEVVRPGGTVLTVTANGYGKRTDARGVPPPVARRLGHHQHPDQRPQRRRRRHRLRLGRARADVDHPAGQTLRMCAETCASSAAPRRASASSASPRATRSSRSSGWRIRATRAPWARPTGTVAKRLRGRTASPRPTSTRATDTDPEAE